MSETNAAASLAAEVDVFNGQQPTLAEYSEWRNGNLPERFKPAEPADPAPAAGETPSEGEQPESAAESEAATDSQEKPQPKKLNAQGRIAQLDAKIEELWAQDDPDVKSIAQLEATKSKIEERAGLKRKTESAPVAQPEAPKPQQQYTRPKPTVNDTNPDGTPKYAGDSAFETWLEDLADWKAEQRIVQVQREQAQQQALGALKAKLDESRSRYDDADAVIFPAAKAISEAQIPPAVKEVFSQSDLFTDLCYVVGSDPEELQKFVSLAQRDPRAAIGQVFEYERGIREELAAASGAAGKPPEKKQTSAPKPPTPVGGSSSRAFDVNDESLSADDWFRKRNAQTGRK
jgi:hypothetical protein